MKNDHRMGLRSAVASDRRVYAVFIFSGDKASYPRVDIFCAFVGVDVCRRVRRSESF